LAVAKELAVKFALEKLPKKQAGLQDIKNALTAFGAVRKLGDAKNALTF
jgi:hypothetical protein